MDTELCPMITDEKIGNASEVSIAPVAKKKIDLQGIGHKITKGEYAIASSPLREYWLLVARWKRLEREFKYSKMIRGNAEFAKFRKDFILDKLNKQVEELDSVTENYPLVLIGASPSALFSHTIDFIKSKDQSELVEFLWAQKSIIEAIAYYFVSIGLEPLAEAILSSDWETARVEIAIVLEAFAPNGEYLSAAYAAKQLVDEESL